MYFNSINYTTSGFCKLSLGFGGDKLYGKIKGALKSGTFHLIQNIAHFHSLVSHDKKICHRTQISVFQRYTEPLTSQTSFTCSESTTETLEKGMKHVQS